MRKMGRTGSMIEKWTSRSTQGLLLAMVLTQNSLTIPPAMAQTSPIFEEGGGRGDEAALAATTFASGRDWPRPNGLRREGYPSSRGSHQRHRQLLAEQERIPYAPISSRNHPHQQEWGQEHRKQDTTTEAHPELSPEPEIAQDGNGSLPLIYKSPNNGKCPVALHTSNSEVLREDRDNAEAPTAIVGAFPVWARLQEALNTSSQLRCPSPPCCLGVHLHTYRGGDLGEEMSHIQGAVVVRRPDLARAPGSLAPAPDLDFVKTFQSYFPISQTSLLRRLVEADGYNLTSETKHVNPTFKTLLDVASFVGGVREGNPAAAELLTPYCSGEDPRQDIEECLRIPTVVSMADAYTSKRGALWNKQNRVVPEYPGTPLVESLKGGDNHTPLREDYIMPVNCQGPVRHEVPIARKIAAKGLPSDPQRYDKVFIMAQEWSPNYYHFTAEHLPRITLMLDVLLENPDIIISMHFYQHDILHENISTVHEVQMEMLEILGISRERVVLVDQQMHADLAIVPTTTICGDPDPHMVNMLRNRLLQGIFPTTNGVPPALHRPVIVLVVRTTLRGLKNNDEVREALKISFPSFDVVEFFGTDPVRDQLKTFANAAMIIAPHGAGLANMIVAPLHTPVLEIAPISCPPCFLRLALKLHHVYARLPGDHWSQKCHAWYEPHVDEIVELARDLLEAKRLADDPLIPPEVTEAHQEHP